MRRKRIQRNLHFTPIIRVVLMRHLKHTVCWCFFSLRFPGGISPATLRRPGILFCWWWVPPLRRISGKKINIKSTWQVDIFLLFFAHLVGHSITFFFFYARVLFCDPLQGKIFAGVYAVFVVMPSHRLSGESFAFYFDRCSCWVLPANFFLLFIAETY